MENQQHQQAAVGRLYRYAFMLAVFTIFYNIAEGIISAYVGAADESFTLFGFGLDSFIEVISGAGIASMILRLRQNPKSHRGTFEKTALRITGCAFYGLTALLAATSVYAVRTTHRPATTLWGAVIAVVSIAIMLLLIREKTRTGKELGSDAIVADAQCTKVCVYMSFVLLVSSTLYQLTGIPYADALGTMGLAWFSFREGKESFLKARTNELCACGQ